MTKIERLTSVNLLKKAIEHLSGTDQADLNESIKLAQLAIQMIEQKEYSLALQKVQSAQCICKMGYDTVYSEAALYIQNNMTTIAQHISGAFLDNAENWNAYEAGYIDGVGFDESAELDDVCDKIGLRSSNVTWTNDRYNPETETGSYTGTFDIVWVFSDESYIAVSNGRWDISDKDGKSWDGCEIDI